MRWPTALSSGQNRLAIDRPSRPWPQQGCPLPDDNPSRPGLVQSTSVVLYDAFLYIKEISDRTAIDAAKKGSADLLILALVDEQDLHGYEIGRLIELRSSGTLRFTMASLYATLYRLEERTLIKGRWVEKAGQRRRRYYRITESGRKVLATQRDDWARFIAALTEVAGVKPA